MKQPFSKTLFLLTAILMITLAIPGPVLADGGGEDGMEIIQTVNGYQITLVFEKPIAVGENPLHIQIVDAMGMPIVDADVEVGLAAQESAHTESEPDAHDEMGENLEPTSSGHNEMSNMSGMGESPTSTPVTPSNSMSGMGGMDEIQPTEVAETHDQMGMTALEAGHEDGEYAGEINIPGAGAWILRVHFTVTGELNEIEIPLTVTGSRTGSIVLTGFFVFNVAIIAAAVIMKPRPGSITSSKEA